jgi:hypothetical protein
MGNMMMLVMVMVMLILRPILMIMMMTPHREQLCDHVLGLYADVLPDGVVGVVVAALDLFKQHSVVVVICAQHYTHIYNIDEQAADAMHIYQLLGVPLLIFSNSTA